MFLLDPYKGFCLAPAEKRRTEHKIETNGFDQLGWSEQSGASDAEDALLGQLKTPSAEEPLEKPGKPEKPEKLSRRAKKELKEQKKATVRKLRDAKNLIVEALSEHSQYNVYNAVLQIKKTHSKTVTHFDSNADVKLFQFGTIAFYKSDLDHIVPGEWLNDNNICLVYEMIIEYLLKPFDFSDQILLLFPSLVQLFLHYPLTDELHTILPMKEISKLKFVFVPFNFMDPDDHLEEANNGDHWTLCVLSMMERRVYVYDSMSSDDDNDELLAQLAKRLLATLFKPNETLSVLKMPCDQQNNFDDCGVFLIMFTCFLVGRMLSQETFSLSLEHASFNPVDGRLTMMKLAHEEAMRSLAAA